MYITHVLEQTLAPIDRSGFRPGSRYPAREKKSEFCYCPSHSAFIPSPLSKPHSYLSFCICSWDISIEWESNISERLCFIKFVKQQNIWSVGQKLLICYHGSVPMCLGEAVFQHILGFILVNGVNPLANRGPG